MLDRRVAYRWVVDRRRREWRIRRRGRCLVGLRRRVVGRRHWCLRCMAEDGLRRMVLAVEAVVVDEGWVLVGRVPRRRAARWRPGVDLVWLEHSRACLCSVLRVEVLLHRRRRMLGPIGVYVLLGGRVRQRVITGMDRIWV